MLYLLEQRNHLAYLWVPIAYQWNHLREIINDEDRTKMFSESSQNNPELYEIVKRLFSVLLIIAIIYFVSMTTYDVSYTIGKHQASLKDDYMMAGNYNNYILIHQNNNFQILMPLKDESTLSREYIYIQNDCDLYPNRRTQFS